MYAIRSYYEYNLAVRLRFASASGREPFVPVRGERKAGLARGCTKPLLRSCDLRDHLHGKVEMVFQGIRFGNRVQRVV